MSLHDYSPPTTAEMKHRQNDERSLRLLLAQRRLYSRAKSWQAVRWGGIVVLGLGAPFVSLLLPALAVGAGALAGVWLFVGRTFLTWAEARDMSKAACIQEELDHYIFGMPTAIIRTERPTPEDVAVLIGDGENLLARAAREKLTNWYPMDVASVGAVTVAIAQRSNAAYTYRLIRTTVAVWAIGVTCWLAILIVWASLIGTSLADFLLGAAFPLLPAFLDVAEYVLSTWRASQDRADLARTITDRLTAGAPRVEGQELLVWQERLFDLRRTTPQVPNWLYSLTRRRNELAMNAVAIELSASTSAEEDGTGSGSSTSQV